MAEYHLHAKTHSRGAGKGAGGHVRYIERQGPYADRDQECIHSESAHTPGWAQTTTAYWDAADAYERANGTVYREIEFALPKELAEVENIALARSFAEHLSDVPGGLTPYTLAIHRSEKDPLLLHCHLMLSDKVNDGIERDASLWFRRAANSGKDPARGGAPKTQARISKDWLREVVRPLWQELANQTLERAGLDIRIDHRSLEAQRQDLEQQAAQERDPHKRRVLEDRSNALDRPPQPKKGRVLTHAGPKKAPERAALVATYERAKAERQAVLKARRAAEWEAEKAGEELARMQRILLAQQQRWEGRDERTIRSRWHTRRNDRATAAEQRPGIRHPDPKEWKEWRYRLLTDEYEERVSHRFGRQIQVQWDSESYLWHLVFTDQDVDVVDYGSRVAARKGGTEREIEVILRVAKIKGWSMLSLTGPAEFQERMARAAISQGFTLEDKDLEARIHAALEREAAERARKEAERRRERIEQARAYRHARRQPWEIQERWSGRQKLREWRRMVEQEAAQALQVRQAWLSEDDSSDAPVIADAVVDRSRKRIPWHKWREKTLVERYGEEIAQRAEKENWYHQIRPDLGGLKLRDGAGRAYRHARRQPWEIQERWSGRQKLRQAQQQRRDAAAAALESMRKKITYYIPSSMEKPEFAKEVQEILQSAGLTRDKTNRISTGLPDMDLVLQAEIAVLSRELNDWTERWNSLFDQRDRDWAQKRQESLASVRRLVATIESLPAEPIEREAAEEKMSTLAATVEITSDGYFTWHPCLDTDDLEDWRAAKSCWIHACEEARIKKELPEKVAALAQVLTKPVWKSTKEKDQQVSEGFQISDGVLTYRGHTRPELSALQDLFANREKAWEKWEDDLREMESLAAEIRFANPRKPLGHFTEKLRSI